MLNSSDVHYHKLYSNHYLRIAVHCCGEYQEFITYRNITTILWTLNKHDLSITTSQFLVVAEKAVLYVLHRFSRRVRNDKKQLAFVFLLQYLVKKDFLTRFSRILMNHISMKYHPGRGLMFEICQAVPCTLYQIWPLLRPDITGSRHSHKTFIPLEIR